MLKIKNLQLKRVEGSIVEFSIEISNFYISPIEFLQVYKNIILLINK